MYTYTDCQFGLDNMPVNKLAPTIRFCGHCICLWVYDYDHTVI